MSLEERFVWGNLFICCIVCWLGWIFFFLQYVAICPSLWQAKQVILLIGGRNLLWHLPNLFNSSLGVHDYVAAECLFISFFVTWGCCLFLIVSLYIMVLMVSNYVDSIFVASLSFTSFTKMISLLSSTLDSLVSPISYLSLYMRRSLSIRNFGQMTRAFHLRNIHS